MTDKESLELAAKAMGGRLVESVLRDEYGEACYEFRTATSTEIWNPLADDGDALRLAVKLGILPGLLAMPAITNQDDPYAAIRRAIVRAAAEIGKEMK